MPQAQGYRADGTPIAAAELPAALARGEAGFRASDKVLLRDQYGTPVEVSGAEVGDRLGSGFSLMGGDEVGALETTKARGTAGQVALTALERGAGAATFGLTDAAAAAMDPELAAAMDERRQVNARAALVGEVAGAVAPALLSGGAGLAGTAARMTPAGQIAALGARAEGLAGGALSGLAARGAMGQAAAKGLGMAASGALEGAAYGAGSVISEAALTNTDLTAEKVLVGGLEGLGMGAAAGFGMGAAGSLLSSAGRGARAAGKAADEVADVAAGAAPSGGGLLTRELDDLANKQTLKALGLQGSDTAALEKKFGKDGLKSLTRRLHDDGLINASEDLATRAKRLETIAEDAGKKVGDLVRRVDAEGGALPTGLDVVRRLRADVIDAKYGRDALSRATNKTLIKKLEKEVLSPLSEMDSGGGASLESLWELRQKVDLMGKPGKEFSALSGGEKAMREARKVIEDEIEKTIGNHSPDLAAAYKSAKQDVHAFSDLAEMSTNRAAREEGNRWFSLSDNLMAAGGITGGLATGDVENAAYGAGLGMVNRLLRTRGTVAAAKIARRLADVNMRRAAAVRAIVDETAPKPSITSGAKRLAAGFNPAQVGRMALLAADDAAASPVAVETPGRPDKDFPVVLASVQQAVANPAEYAEHIGNQLGDVAFDEPHLAEAIVRNAIADAGYLADHAPRGYTRADHGSMTPQAELAAIPRHEMESFMRRVQALNDPLSVAEAVANGDIPLDAIDALRARRPEMYQELRVDIIRATAEREKPLPFSRRMALGVAFEFPADRSLDREYADRLQQDYAARAQAAQKQAPPPPQPGKPDSGQIMTPAQKLVMGA